MTQQELCSLENKKIQFFMKDVDGICHKYEGTVQTVTVLVNGDKKYVLRLVDVLKDNNFSRNMCLSYNLTKKLSDWKVIR